MGREYIYFSASLPWLSFDGDLPMTVKDFLEKCDTLLAKEEYLFMVQLLNLSSKTVDTHQSELRSLFELRNNGYNAVAESRAMRAGKDPSDHIRGSRYKDDYFSDMLAQAGKEDNLLDGQRAVDRALWQHFDHVQSGHFNDITFIACYGLKLMILEKQDAFDAQKGSEKLEEFKKLCMAQEV